MFNLRLTDLNFIINIIISIGVILAAIAPFLHIIPSKESTDKVFGFNNLRSFLYALGLPVSLLTISIFVAFLSNLLELRPYKEVIKVASWIFISVSMYFIVWTFWYREDFNVYLYYLAIILISVLTAYSINKMLKTVTARLKTLNNISIQIPKLKSDIEYVNGIADIMPENDDLITFKAMLDNTGDDLKKTYDKIQNDLNIDQDIIKEKSL